MSCIPFCVVTKRGTAVSKVVRDAVSTRDYSSLQKSQLVLSMVKTATPSYSRGTTRSCEHTPNSCVGLLPEPISSFIFVTRLGEESSAIAIVRRFVDYKWGQTTSRCATWSAGKDDRRCFDARRWSVSLVSQVPVRYYRALVQATTRMQTHDWSTLADALAAKLKRMPSWRAGARC